jgi:hypothetical protein
MPIRDLDSAVRNSALWDKYQLLSSVPGVGPVLSVALLMDLPELGRLKPRGRRAGESGPFNYDIGALRGQRKIQGGGKRLAPGCVLGHGGFFSFELPAAFSYRTFEMLAEILLIAFTATPTPAAVPSVAVARPGSNQPWYRRPQ